MSFHVSVWPSVLHIFLCQYLCTIVCITQMVLIKAGIVQQHTNNSISIFLFLLALICMEVIVNYSGTGA